MKKAYIAAAVAIAVVGFAGVQQVKYKAQVNAGVEQLTKQINTSVLLENKFQAKLHSQQSSYFSSTGVITVATTAADDLNELEIEYTVSHGPLALLTGAGYEIHIVNTAFEGEREQTITSTLFNGEPITIQGSLRSNSINGVLKVPTANFSKNGKAMNAEPILGNFSASNFNSYGTANTYEVSIKAPVVSFIDQEFKLDILNSNLHVNSDLNEQDAAGDINFQLEKMSGWYTNNNNDTEELLLSNLVINSHLNIEKELYNSNVYKLDTLKFGSEHYSDAEFSYTFSGIHGPTALEVMHLSRNANHKKWENSELLDAIINLLFERVPELLSLNPEFNIHTLKANKNGELFLNANSSALLDTSKLPSNFADSLDQLNVFSTSTALLNALQLNIDAEIGLDFAESISRVNPLLGAVISSHNDTLSFSMKNGETTLNGSKL